MWLSVATNTPATSLRPELHLLVSANAAGPRLKNQAFQRHARTCYSASTQQEDTPAGSPPAAPCPAINGINIRYFLFIAGAFSRRLMYTRPLHTRRKRSGHSQPRPKNPLCVFRARDTRPLFPSTLPCDACTSALATLCAFDRNVCTARNRVHVPKPTPSVISIPPSPLVAPLCRIAETLGPLTRYVARIF